MTMTTTTTTEVQSKRDERMSEYHRESAMASVLRPLFGSVGALDSLLLRPDLYTSLHCAAVET
ncbi:hypothetical protein [Ilumatobacter sp.]|uniref:hypothetical protein n=1 Tax=Ilumatobacter sp. TaxID=1967498 RepID=UPI003750A2E4